MSGDPVHPPAKAGPDWRADPGALPESTFPAVRAERLRVQLEPAVYRELIAHSKSDESVEIGGVLLGREGRDAAGPHLRITGSIRAEHAENQGAQITFTHKTWEHIHNALDRRAASQGSQLDGGGDERIVGWYHTHPGFGIFLSDRDLFIHEHFFNGPRNLAMVVDPKSGEEGIFHWQDGKVRPLPGWWVGEEARQGSRRSGPDVPGSAVAAATTTEPGRPGVLSGKEPASGEAYGGPVADDAPPSPGSMILFLAVLVFLLALVAGYATGGWLQSALRGLPPLPGGRP